MTEPLVSILMVARNAAAFIDAALASARAQSLADIEIVVVDDASTDETGALALRHAGEDARVRVVEGPGTGLAAVRNVSLRAARGRYGLVLDSDDLLQADHAAQLVAAAQRSGAPMVISNMMAFETAPEQARVFAQGRRWRREQEVDLCTYLRANGAGRGVALGYMKPLFDMPFLRENGFAYDSQLRIGEDFDLVLRAMLAGGRLLYTPACGYLYRRHAASVSHRMPLADLRALLAAQANYALPEGRDVARAAMARRAQLTAALAHGEAVAALKARRPAGALRALGGSLRGWALLAHSLWEGGLRRAGAAWARDDRCPSR